MHLAIQNPKHLSDMQIQVRGQVFAAMTASDRSLSIPYPSRNSWIIDEIALWLTLGRLPWVTQGMLDRRFVVQGSDVRDLLDLNSPCVVAHYFSKKENLFMLLLAHRTFSR